jgi:hypothetical protein
MRPIAVEADGLGSHRNNGAIGCHYAAFLDHLQCLGDRLSIIGDQGVRLRPRCQGTVILIGAIGKDLGR